jgi:hypothetical protein
MKRVTSLPPVGEWQTGLQGLLNHRVVCEEDLVEPIPARAFARRKVVRPGAGKISPIRPQALDEQVHFRAVNEPAIGTRVFNVLEQVGADGRGSRIEFLTPFSAERQPVAKDQPEQEGQQRDPGRRQDFVQHTPLGVSEPRLYRTGRFEHGGAIAQILGLVFVIAFSLGVFGPNLDRIAFSNHPVPTDPADEIALFEAVARHKCNPQPTDNRGWILAKDGAIVCTDKHGRVRSQVTTLVRAAR